MDTLDWTGGKDLASLQTNVFYPNETSFFYPNETKVFYPNETNGLIS
jgi:hypothetical protein